MERRTYGWKHTALIAGAILLVSTLAIAIVPITTNTIAMPEATDMGKCPAGKQAKNCLDNVGEAPTWHYMDGGTANLATGGGGGGGGTFATTYSNTPSNNRVTANSTGGGLLIEPSSSGQGELFRVATNTANTLLRAADNGAATLVGNAANSGTNVGATIGALTALTSSRHYASFANGGTEQWAMYTDGSSAQTLRATTGSNAVVSGNGHLRVSDAASGTDYTDFSSTGVQDTSISGSVGLFAGTNTYAFSNAADGASALGIGLGSFQTWANATAKLLSVLNNTTHVMDVFATGKVVLGGADSSIGGNGTELDLCETDPGSCMSIVSLSTTDAALEYVGGAQLDLNTFGFDLFGEGGNGADIVGTTELTLRATTASSEVVHIDQGNLTNIEGLTIDNIGAGTSGILLSSNSAGSWGIDAGNGGNAEWATLTTNNSQKYEVRNEAFSGVDYAFTFLASALTATKTFMRWTSFAGQTGDILQVQDSTPTTLMRIDAGGDVLAPHFGSFGASVPVCTPGANTGAGASCSVTGGDSAFVASLTTGTGIGSGTIGSVSIAPHTAFTSKPACLAQIGNSAQQYITGWSCAMNYASSTTSAIVVDCGGSGANFNDTTTYPIIVHCIQ